MKKLFLVFFSVVCVMVSCNTVPENFENEKTATREVSQFSHQEQILLYSLSGDCKIDDDDIVSDLNSLLDINVTENVFATDEITSSVNPNSFVKVVKKKTYQFGSNAFTTLSYDDLTKSESNVNVYILEIKNEDEKKFAVVSDDMRVGSVLCISDKEIDDSFMTEIIDSYVESIKKENDAIDEKAIEEFKIKYNITDEDIQKAMMQKEELTGKMFGYEYTPWVLNKQNLENRVNIFWGKEHPYTDAIEAVYGFSSELGETELMIAQILAYYKPNYKCSQKNLLMINEKWDKARNYNDGKGWDGVYNWDEMTKGASYSECSELGQICIGALFFELSRIDHTEKKIRLQKGIDGIIMLRKIGFEHNNIWTLFNFRDISRSIDKCRPVFCWLFYGVNSPIYRDEIVRWNNHYSWIIDGYRQFKRRKTFYFLWIPFRSTQYDDFICCNFGVKKSESMFRADLLKKSIGHEKNFVSAVTNLHLVK